MSDRLDNHVLLLTYADEPEANLLAARLREAGIGAEVVGGVSSTVLGPYAGHNSPVRVMVFADQIDEAQRLLAEIWSPSETAAPMFPTTDEAPSEVHRSAMATSETYGRFAVAGMLSLFVVTIGYAMYQYVSDLIVKPRYDQDGAGIVLFISTVAIAVIVVSVVGFCRLVSRLMRG